MNVVALPIYIAALVFKLYPGRTLPESRTGSAEQKLTRIGAALACGSYKNQP